MKRKFFKIETILFLTVCFIGCDNNLDTEEIIHSESNERQPNDEDTDADSIHQSDSNTLASVEEPDAGDSPPDTNREDTDRTPVTESDASDDNTEQIDMESGVDTSTDFDDSETLVDMMCLFIKLPPDMTEIPRELRLFYHVEPSLDVIVEDVPVPIEDWSEIPSEVYSPTPDITPGYYYLTFVLFVEGGGEELPVAGKDLSWTTQLFIPTNTQTPEFGPADLSVELSPHSV